MSTVLNTPTENLEIEQAPAKPGAFFMQKNGDRNNIESVYSPLLNDQETSYQSSETLDQAALKLLRESQLFYGIYQRLLPAGNGLITKFTLDRHGNPRAIDDKDPGDEPQNSLFIDSTKHAQRIYGYQLVQPSSSGVTITEYEIKRNGVVTGTTVQLDQQGRFKSEKAADNLLEIVNLTIILIKGSIAKERARELFRRQEKSVEEIALFEFCGKVALDGKVIKLEGKHYDEHLKRIKKAGETAVFSTLPKWDLSAIQERQRYHQQQLFYIAFR